MACSPYKEGLCPSSGDINRLMMYGGVLNKSIVLIKKLRVDELETQRGVVLHIKKFGFIHSQYGKIVDALTFIVVSF
jgi:hypothetical protein